MTENIVIGRCYTHKLHGHCIVINQNKNGFWITVWGGVSGDKPYTFKSISAADLSPKPNGCK